MKLPLAKDNVISPNQLENFYSENHYGYIVRIADDISKFHTKLVRYYSFDSSDHVEVNNRIVKSLQDAGYKVKHEGTQYKVSW